MVLIKLFYTNILLICLIHFSLLEATIVDVELMNLGKDVIVLYKDQHRFDDSQEIWQAASILLAATSTPKPVDLILVEKNDILTLWNNLPDAFTANSSSQSKHAASVQNLTGFYMQKIKYPVPNVSEIYKLIFYRQ